MENFIFCTEEEIRDYLRLFGAGRDSHDYELSEAVRLKRFYDQQLNRPHLIGVPILPEGLRQMNTGKVSKNDVIKKFRKENTDVDILIIDAEDSHSTPRDSFRGDVFQIKRFTDEQFDGDFDSSSIKILKKILEKGYSHSPYLSLYIAINLKPQVHTPTWDLLAKFLSTQKVPFTRIVMGPITNEHGEELVAEIYPRVRFLKI